MTISLGLLALLIVVFLAINVKSYVHLHTIYTLETKVTSIPFGSRQDTVKSIDTTIIPDKIKHGNADVIITYFTKEIQLSVGLNIDANGKIKSVCRRGLPDTRPFFLSGKHPLNPDTDSSINIPLSVLQGGIIVNAQFEADKSTSNLVVNVKSSTIEPSELFRCVVSNMSPEKVVVAMSVITRQMYNGNPILLPTAVFTSPAYTTTKSSNNFTQHVIQGAISTSISPKWLNNLDKPLLNAYQTGNKYRLNYKSISSSSHPTSSQAHSMYPFNYSSISTQYSHDLKSSTKSVYNAHRHISSLENSWPENEELQLLASYLQNIVFYSSEKPPSIGPDGWIALAAAIPGRSIAEIPHALANIMKDLKDMYTSKLRTDVQYEKLVNKYEEFRLQTVETKDIITRVNIWKRIRDESFSECSVKEVMLEWFNLLKMFCKASQLSREGASDLRETSVYGMLGKSVGKQLRCMKSNQTTRS